MRILLADEDPRALARLHSALAVRGDVEVVGAARDGGEAADLIETLRPDMVFLDVQIPVRNGLPLARALTAIPGVDVVFMASAEEMARRPAAVPANDLLVKPVEPDTLDRMIARARERSGAQLAQAPVTAYADALWAPGTSGLVRVDVDMIDWIEAARDYVLLHTATRSHIVRSTMAALERSLDPGRMIRVSRSAFVQHRRIEAVERHNTGYAVRLKGGRSVRVGATYGRVVEALDGRLS